MDALAPEARAAEHVRGHGAVRVEPRLPRPEEQPWLAEVVYALPLLGRDRALDPEELPPVGELGVELRRVDVGKDSREPVGRRPRVDHLLRLRVERGGHDVGGEDRAVAIDDVGPLGPDRLAGDAGAGLDRDGGGEQRHPPGDGREAEDENDPEEQEPGLRLGPLGAVAGGEARRALLGLDQVRILALGAGFEDAGERAQRTSDHGVAPAVVTRSVGSGGKATVAASPNWSGVSSASPSASAFWATSSRRRSGRLR